MTLRLLAATVILMLCAACPGPGGGDGGTGGGNAGTGGGSTGTGGGTGGSTGGGTGGSGDIPVDRLCAETRDAVCSALVRCGIITDLANCLRIIDFSDGCLATQLPALDAGRLGYDGAQARICVSQFVNVTCADFDLSNNAACDATFPGRVQLNGFCTSDNECTAGNYCRNAPLTCGGTCTAKVPVGQPVTQDDRCVDGAVQYGGVCTQPTLTQGASCANPDGGFTPLPCVAPSRCSYVNVPDAGFRYLCTANTAEIGQPCADVPAGVTGCGGFSSCDPATRRCIGFGSAGAACAPGGDCKLDLWCNQVSGQCQALSAQGGACLRDSTCADGACDGGGRNPDGGNTPVLGACVPPPGLGQPCTDRCAPGLVCDGSTDRCIAPKADGVACTGSDECTSRLCTERADGGRTCGPCN